MNPGPKKLPAYLRRLLLPAVWRKAAPIGLFVGVIQICVNQGDHWLKHEITAAVLLKTILCPLISVGVAVVSAAAAHPAEEKSPSKL
ncbi:MAG: hypothetical protein QM715_00895 [Nibricoccus sp.]